MPGRLGGSKIKNVLKNEILLDWFCLALFIFVEILKLKMPDILGRNW